jgi:hypothetical protein
MTETHPLPAIEDAATAQLRVAVEAARAAVARGESQDHEAVRTWLQGLAEARREPPPRR